MPMWVDELTVEASEVALLLLLLHRSALIVVDQAALALGGSGQEHLADDQRQRVRVALDRPAQRIAAQRAEADLAKQRHLTLRQWQAGVGGHAERGAAQWST